MKFVFPQNFDFKNKLFGFIDYSTVIFNLIWYILIFIIINLFIKQLNFKIFLFITFCFPVFLFSISGFQGENIVYVLYYMLKFIFKQKLFFYSKIKH